MKVKFSLICALSLNIVLASAVNAKSKEDIAADRADIQKIYNIYNNEIVVENNSLMRALNSYGNYAKNCASDFTSNEDKESSLANSVSSYEKKLKAFELSYKDIKASYARQLKQLELLDKVKEIDSARLLYARDLLKNINLKDPNDLRQIRNLESTLDSIESRYTMFYQLFATTSTSFSLVKPQINGIATSKENLEKFFKVAKENLEKSQGTIKELEPKVLALYDDYQKYLDIAISNYNAFGILSEDILAKTLESFYDIKGLKEKDFIFDSFKNLKLNDLAKPQDMLKISLVSKREMSASALKSKAGKEPWGRAASYEDSSDGFSSGGNNMLMRSAAGQKSVEKTIKELRQVNAIIDDLNYNLDTANAVLTNIKSLSATIKSMSDKSISMLKQALNLSTESQVLLTNVEIFKGELDIKSRQSNIAVDNIKKSLDKILSSKSKINELL